MIYETGSADPEEGRRRFFLQLSQIGRQTSQIGAYSAEGLCICACDMPAVKRLTERAESVMQVFRLLPRLFNLLYDCVYGDAVRSSLICLSHHRAASPFGQ